MTPNQSNFRPGKLRKPLQHSSLFERFSNFKMTH